MNTQLVRVNNTVQLYYIVLLYTVQYFLQLFMCSPQSHSSNNGSRQQEQQVTAVMRGSCIQQLRWRQRDMRCCPNLCRLSRLPLDQVREQRLLLRIRAMLPKHLTSTSVWEIKKPKVLSGWISCSAPLSPVFVTRRWGQTSRDNDISPSSCGGQETTCSVQLWFISCSCCQPPHQHPHPPEISSRANTGRGGRRGLGRRQYDCRSADLKTNVLQSQITTQLLVFCSNSGISGVQPPLRAGEAHTALLHH